MLAILLGFRSDGSATLLADPSKSSQALKEVLKDGIPDGIVRAEIWTQENGKIFSRRPTITDEKPADPKAARPAKAPK